MAFRTFQVLAFLASITLVILLLVMGANSHHAKPEPPTPAPKTIIRYVHAFQKMNATRCAAITKGENESLIKATFGPDQSVSTGKNPDGSKYYGMYVDTTDSSPNALYNYGPKSKEGCWVFFHNNVVIQVWQENI